MSRHEPVLTMSGIRKAFPGVVALDGVDFRLLPGEVHALMGENGAGKSTLIKVLTGVYDVDDGRIELEGRPVRFSGPGQAQQCGISTVYQEVNLCPNLSIAENIFIGRQPGTRPLVRWSAMRRRATELLERLHLGDLDVNAALGSCSIAIQQMVAIARALDVDARVLILDEPTSSLDAAEVAELFRVIRQLKTDGVAVLFVSHFLDQVYEIADRMTVLRNGKLIGEYPVAELPPVALVGKMLGREREALEELQELSVRPDGADGENREAVLAAEGLGRTGAIEPFDLTVHSGEVVGLAGLLGSGRTEIARLFFGADRPDRGRLRMDDQAVTLHGPRDAMARRIAFCPEDRRNDGLIEDLTVRENIILALQAARGWARPLPRRRQDELVQEYVDLLGIRLADPERPVRELSGGNQQKVLLARWLITRPRLLIVDEPTRGIDVGAKAEIQRLLTRLALEGMAVLFISAELEEVLRLSHRIAVLRDHRVVRQLENQEGLTVDSLTQVIADGGAA